MSLDPPRSAQAAASGAASSPEVLTECVQRARAGDASAWTEIHAGIRSQVVARLPLHPSVNRDEVASETTADVWRALRSLRDDQKLLSFAATVARRVVARKRREQTRYLPLLEELAEPSCETAPGVESDLDNAAMVARLQGTLKSADRKLFRLLYVVGKSGEEVQEELGVSGRLLRQRKHRLHEKLRRTLDPLAGEPTE